MSETLREQLVGPSDKSFSYTRYRDSIATLRTAKITLREPCLSKQTLERYGLYSNEGLSLFGIYVHIPTRLLIVLCDEKKSFTIRKDIFDLQDIINRTQRNDLLLSGKIIENVHYVSMINANPEHSAVIYDDENEEDQADNEEEEEYDEEDADDEEDDDDDIDDYPDEERVGGQRFIGNSTIHESSSQIERSQLRSELLTSNEKNTQSSLESIDDDASSDKMEAQKEDSEYHNSQDQPRSQAPEPLIGEDLLEEISDIEKRLDISIPFEASFHGISKFRDPIPQIPIYLGYSKQIHDAVTISAVNFASPNYEDIIQDNLENMLLFQRVYSLMDSYVVRVRLYNQTTGKMMPDVKYALNKRFQENDTKDIIEYIVDWYSAYEENDCTVLRSIVSNFDNIESLSDHSIVDESSPLLAGDEVSPTNEIDNGTSEDRPVHEIHAKIAHKKTTPQISMPRFRPHPISSFSKIKRPKVTRTPDQLLNIFSRRSPDSEEGKPLQNPNTLDNTNDRITVREATDSPPSPESDDFYDASEGESPMIESQEMNSGTNDEISSVVTKADNFKDSPSDVFSLYYQIFEDQQEEPQNESNGQSGTHEPEVTEKQDEPDSDPFGAFYRLFGSQLSEKEKESDTVELIDEDMHDSPVATSSPLLSSVSSDSDESDDSYVAEGDISIDPLTVDIQKSAEAASKSNSENESEIDNGTQENFEDNHLAADSSISQSVEASLTDEQSKATHLDSEKQAVDDKATEAEASDAQAVEDGSLSGSENSPSGSLSQMWKVLEGDQAEVDEGDEVGVDEGDRAEVDEEHEVGVDEGDRVEVESDFEYSEKPLRTYSTLTTGNSLATHDRSVSSESESESNDDLSDDQSNDHSDSPESPASSKKDSDVVEDDEPSLPSDTMLEKSTTDQGVNVETQEALPNNQVEISVTAATTIEIELTTGSEEKQNLEDGEVNTDQPDIVDASSAESDDSEIIYESPSKSRISAAEDKVHVTEKTEAATAKVASSTPVKDPISRTNKTKEVDDGSIHPIELSEDEESSSSSIFTNRRSTRIAANVTKKPGSNKSSPVVSKQVDLNSSIIEGNSGSENSDAADSTDYLNLLMDIQNTQVESSRRSRKRKSPGS
ncbi:hypothetical protein CANARDRAFT_28849 [[Candida] arabinofermentans NRRL YB-2248]|uniref:Uncharacterized protein n=1 Tax=[Candida] arabinofermentans NRRL YB-2248 TaxID=983967 RepID=A0A1E4SYV8_9ASCO|nr:hypothetical protein CANARDRAFT_28849 [[Candida] arabinofermentans NRRL YB-2248]